MKKYKNLIEKIASYDNILISIKEVIRGNKKRSYLSSQEILNNLEFYCRKIHNDLMSGTFTPSGYREFSIIEGKKTRVIQSLSNSQATGLAKKIISFNSVKKFNDLGIKQEPRKRMLNGKKVSTNDIINLPIIITDVVEDVVTGKFEDPSDGVKHVNKTAVEFIYVNDESQSRYKFITSAYLLVNALKEMKDYLPVLVTIRKSSDPSNLGRSYLKFE